MKYFGICIHCKIEDCKCKSPFVATNYTWRGKRKPNPLLKIYFKRLFSLYRDEENKIRYASIYSYLMSGERDERHYKKNW